ncbi:MAG TPA: NAD-dependent epimerase/dehydratase family protein [Terriglobales bacterium]|nr:NAD-dependent epimerase/dehydratase family protein [Terriglobales bacterium]
MQTSVVTGAAGFVGQALVRRLLAAGDTVRAVVLRDDPAARELARLPSADPAALTIFEGDITRTESVTPAFEAADRVFHTAALVHAWAPRAEFERVNVLGSRNVAELALAHGVPRLIAISTSDVFGLPEGNTVFTERSPHRPWGEPYADTKIEAERWLWRLQRESGLPVTVIYPGWVYGPGDKAFFPGLAKAIAAKQMFFWAKAVRLPLVYIDNLIDAVMLAANSPQAVGNGYIVFDTEQGPTMEELAAAIAQKIGVRAPSRHLPYAMTHRIAAALQTIWRVSGRKTPPPLMTVDVKAFGSQFHLSNEKVKRELGWQPKVSIEAGLAAALAALAL